MLHDANLVVLIVLVAVVVSDACQRRSLFMSTRAYHLIGNVCRVTNNSPRLQTLPTLIINNCWPSRAQKMGTHVQPGRSAKKNTKKRQEHSSDRHDLVDERVRGSSKSLHGHRDVRNQEQAVQLWNLCGFLHSFTVGNDDK